MICLWKRDLVFGRAIPSSVLSPVSPRSVPKAARLGRGNGIPDPPDTESESTSWEVVFRGTWGTEWGRSAVGRRGRRERKRRRRQKRSNQLLIVLSGQKDRSTSDQVIYIRRPCPLQMRPTNSTSNNTDQQQPGKRIKRRRLETTCVQARSSMHR
jgi:hypothetical protein